MSTKRPRQPGGSDRERDSDRDQEFENDKGNSAHLEIEERRFRGGLPPTPDLYALAREQWNKLPGSVVRPPMDSSNPPAPATEPAKTDKKNEEES